MPLTPDGPSLILTGACRNPVNGVSHATYNIHVNGEVVGELMVESFRDGRTAVTARSAEDLPQELGTIWLGVK